MEEPIHAHEEIGLSDIFRILLRKLKVLILALLIGVIVGAGFGVMKTVNVNYYGTSVDFYVNPKKDTEGTAGGSQYGVYGAYGRHVMDNMTKLLASESFAEQLLLDPATGLPQFTSTTEKVDELKGYIAAAKEKQTALAADPENATLIAEEKEARETALTCWRETALYRTLIRKITASVSYTYYNESEADAEDLAKSFIYVKISVLNDEDFAKAIFNQITAVLPAYVEENMPQPDGYNGTNCQRITRLDKVGLLNGGYTTSTAVKYGLILGAAAFVIACVAVVVIDRSNKRLRDYELTMEKFHVPVLGVIPRIEDRESASKPAATAKTEVTK